MARKERKSKLDYRLDGMDKELAEIKKLLNNHIAHHEIYFNRWVKVVIPIIATATPIFIALIQAYFRFALPK